MQCSFIPYSGDFSSIKYAYFFFPLPFLRGSEKGPNVSEKQTEEEEEKEKGELSISLLFPLIPPPPLEGEEDSI